MNNYVTCTTLIIVSIIYTYFLNNLLKRNIILLKKDVTENDLSNVPDKVLLYIKNKEGNVTTNFDKDVEKYFEDIEDEQEKTIPRHGVYTFSVTNTDNKKIIVGVPK
jgi:cell division protein FtsN